MSANTRPSLEEEAEAVTSQDDSGNRNSSAGLGFPDYDDVISISFSKIDYTTRTRPDGSQEPVIHVYGRNNENELEHIKVYGFEPYFYAPTNEVGNIIDDGRANGSRDGFKSIRMDDVSRVYTHLPKHVRNLRENVSNHYEADIQFANRFIIDKEIENGVIVPERRKDDGTIVVPHDEVEPLTNRLRGVEHRTMMFDIEVEDRRGFPEDGEEELISITTHDSFKDRYIVWYYDAEDGNEGPDSVPDSYESISDDVDIRVVKFDDEVEMVRGFLSYMENLNPDIVTAWNVSFDVPYMIDRLNILNDQTDDSVDLAPGRMARLGDAWYNSYDQTLKGRVVIDLLEAYKRTKFTEIESYRLDAVAQLELDMGKETYTGDIGELWEDNPETLVEYNLRDVELCVEINRKNEILPFWRQVQTFVGAQLTDAPIPGDICDMYVLHKAKGRFVLPSAEYTDAEEIEGGAVFDPIEGVRENVVVLDLKSLYPMSMTTINASPETKVENPEEYDGETFVAPTGTEFRKDEHGFVREMIDDLLDERDRLKGERDENEPGAEEYELRDRQQAAIKVVMNSLYGTLSWEKFRLYDADIGNAVTATGRDVIKFTEKVVNELDREILYGDTDSVMYQIPDITEKDELITRAHEHEDYINDRYDDFAKERLNADDHRFQIEFEKLYKRFFQAGKKKRYAGHIIYKEGKDVDKTDITGFEFKRSDQSAITKRVQQNVIESIVHGADEEEIIDYIQGVVSDFKNGDVDLEEVGMPGGIGKDLDDYATETAQVRGAIYANLFLGTNFRQGSKPKRVYLEDVDSSFFNEVVGVSDAEDQSHVADFKRDPDVICYEYEEQVPEEFHVDWDKMLDKTLKGQIGRVITAIGISWDEVTVDETQRGLDEFM